MSKIWIYIYGRDPFYINQYPDSFVVWSHLHAFLACGLQPNINNEHSHSLEIWPENGVRHIVTSWILFGPHMKRIVPIRMEPWGHIWSDWSQIGTGPWGGNVKSFERHIWPWPLIYWPGNDTRHIVTSWVKFVLHIKWTGQIDTEPRAWQKIGMTLDRWPGNSVRIGQSWSHGAYTTK